MKSVFRTPIENFDEKIINFQAVSWDDFNESMDNQGMDWNDYEEDKDEKYIIRIFGITKDSHSICVNVKKFTPFFYIKVHDSWNKNNVKILLDKIKQKLVIKKNGIWVKREKSLLEGKCILLKKKDFYGFSGCREFKFLRLVFDNSEAMKRTIGIINSHNQGKNKLYGFDKLPLYESNLDPILRLCHLRNLQMTSWISISNFKVVDPILYSSSCQIEIDVNWIDLNRIFDDSNAPILQAGFDIEVFSNDYSFPIPDVKENVVTQIATCFKFFGDQNLSLIHLICLKKCAEIDKSKYECDLTVESYNTEEEVLLAWNRLIRKTDPDVLYTYNGDQFDCNYMYVRAKMLGIEDEFSKLGRVKHVKSTIKESSFSSSAYGENKYLRLTMPGRINFDLLIFIRREYKESSYKLDYISEKYLGQNKNPVTPNMIFDFYRSGTPEEIKILGEYCIVDTLLLQKLVDKLCILQNVISMSNITCVPIKFLIERGQQIKVFSQLLRETRKQGFLVPTINRYGEAKDDESFEGATVLTPMKGIYTEPITVCDFESLYPSIIRAHNLCFSTIILDDSQINESVEYETISWDQSDIKYSFKFVQNTPGILPKLLSELAGSRKRYKKMMKEAKDPFLKEVYNKSQLAVKVSMNSIYGFLAAPMLCCKPIAATVTAVGRDMIKKTKNYIEEKYPSVCVYGDTDSVMVKFTTKTTQKYLEAVNSGSKDIERMRCICIKESIDLGKIVAKKVTEDLFKSPINLEYEKIFCPMLLLSKKRYIGKLYSDDPSKFDKMDNKGVVLTRRDNTSLLKKVYKKIVDILLESGNRGIGEVLEYVNTVLYQILNGEIDIDDIIISKTFKTTYKNKNIPHVVLVDKIKQRGGDVRSNERVPYVFVEKIEYTIRGKPKKLSQYHKVEDPEYVKEHKIPLDAEYYIKSMMNPICEVLELFMENPEEIFKSVIQEYKNSRW